MWKLEHSIIIMLVDPFFHRIKMSYYSYILLTSHGSDMLKVLVNSESPLYTALYHALRDLQKK